MRFVEDEHEHLAVYILVLYGSVLCACPEGISYGRVNHPTMFSHNHCEKRIARGFPRNPPVRPFEKTLLIQGAFVLVQVSTERGDCCIGFVKQEFL
jgi:hypothetical protein